MTKKHWNIVDDICFAFFIGLFIIALDFSKELSFSNNFTNNIILILFTGLYFFIKYIMSETSYLNFYKDKGVFESILFVVYFFVLYLQLLVPLSYPNLVKIMFIDSPFLLVLLIGLIWYLFKTFLFIIKYFTSD